MANTFPLPSVTSPLSFPLAALGLGALLAVGCGNAGSGLADAARGITKHSTQLNDRGAEAGAEDMSDEAAADDEASDAGANGAEANDPTPNGASADGRKLKDAPAMAVEGPLSDDSVRCGDGILDDDELCDVGIADGETGACPTECEPLDACHEAKMEVHSCWSQCVLGAEIPCS